MAIARYDMDYDSEYASEDGLWVRYEDHQQTVAQLQARVAKLERALVNANRRIGAAADALQSVLKP